MVVPSAPTKLYSHANSNVTKIVAREIFNLDGIVCTIEFENNADRIETQNRSIQLQYDVTYHTAAGLLTT